MRRKNLVWIAPLAILAMLLFAYIAGEIVLHLWNWLLPSLFRWQPITFWDRCLLSKRVSRPSRAIRSVRR